MPVFLVACFSTAIQPGWVVPDACYANKHIYARNDEEIISASLAADGR